VERTPQTIVLDASVAAKWFLEEEDSDKALIVREAHINGSVSLAAPDLLIYEVANALHYNPKVSEEQLTGRVQDLFDYDLDLVPPSNEYVTRAVKAARRLSISIYDASYIALSEIISTNLVTADKKLYEKTSAKGQTRLLKALGHTWTLPE
jgi:predicted nucleic acid-binding protein